MRELDERNITDTVLETFAKTPDRRFKQIIDTVVRSLHDCTRELRLTPDEWLAAIRFLTAVGHKTSEVRQEFILLSDTLGVSALVNLMNNQGSETTTTASLLGPFFRENAPVLPAGGSIAPNDTGEPILLTGRVQDETGKAIADAMIDVWQTGSNGLYDIQGPQPQEMDLRGRFRTDADGRYNIRTVLPLGYSIPTDGPVGDMLRAGARHGCRPAHIHFLLSAPSFQELATALYIASSEYIDSDAVFGVSRSLTVEPESGGAAEPRHITYDFVLARAGKSGSVRVGADPSKTLSAAE